MASRELVGYGETPPLVKWPQGARLALNFVINYEEGGENCTINGDNASESLLSEIVGAQPYKVCKIFISNTVPQRIMRCGNKTHPAQLKPWPRCTMM